MISGPPGIGKTSAVNIISSELGYSVVTINASDKRSQTKIDNLLKELSQCSTISYFVKKDQEDEDAELECREAKDFNRKTVIVMDEVDGCTACDKGGIAALVKIIKVSKMPIVCVANEGGSRKLQHLKLCCYELKFEKPNN